VVTGGLEGRTQGKETTCPDEPNTSWELGDPRKEKKSLDCWQRNKKQRKNYGRTAYEKGGGPVQDRKGGVLPGGGGKKRKKVDWGEKIDPKWGPAPRGVGGWEENKKKIRPASKN